MRVFVAGRSGQTAAALAEQAERAGDIEIILAGRSELDIRDAASVARQAAAARPDVVVNAAAYTAVDKAESEPEAALAVNGQGAANLAGAAAAIGVPLIHLSTDYIFDGTKTEPYVETDAAHPQGAYGRSKLAGERAVAAATPRHVILRTAWLYGPFGVNFVKTMLRLAAEGKEPRVVDDQHGNPTYTPDLAAAILAVARCIAVGSPRPDLFGVFHLVGPEATTWYGFACEIMAASRAAGGPAARVTPIPTSGYPTAAKRPANSRLATAKIEAVYGLRLPPRAASLAACVRRLYGDRG